MPLASAPAARTKIGTVTVTAEANASVICMRLPCCSPPATVNRPVGRGLAYLATGCLGWQRSWYDSSSVDRQRPVVRSNCQPCMVQVSVVPLISPNRPRSAAQVRAAALHDPVAERDVFLVVALVRVPALGVHRAGRAARHLKNVYRYSLYGPTRRAGTAC